eukprot:CAMPEP_0204618932 /NCGR_PEP_ID=MMETSP0717-20131115/5439_1 /ASSEMBLY_ACC=CAM_ASM_000666 /TAXON_ID=230516 /ORGANISM="Chaetoceros curvisetus" /LENGTH=325 /DNA_ID=CAMNT_0051632797 /DNA_START=189 /DNA_END=1164 /DNA_ORIENTATION=+
MSRKKNNEDCRVLLVINPFQLSVLLLLVVLISISIVTQIRTCDLSNQIPGTDGTISIQATNQYTGVTGTVAGPASEETRGLVNKETEKTETKPHIHPETKTEKKKKKKKKKKQLREQKSPSDETEFLTSIDKNGLLTPLLPLRPPFHIWIFSQPRSGSTFMHHLLDTIVKVKSPSDTHVNFHVATQRAEPEEIFKHESFVIKSHIPPKYDDKRVRSLFEEGKVAVFTSVNDATSKDEKAKLKKALKGRKKVWEKIKPYALHTQTKQDAQSCSKCEVIKYQKNLQMTDDEVERVADYIDTFAYIRKCCGLQSSKWERKRLHQCPIT